MMVGQAITDCRKKLPVQDRQSAEAEGGCGLVGMACNVPLEGKYLLRARGHMRNRGNGKGGGMEALSIVHEQLGASENILREAYILQVGDLDRPTWEQALSRPI